MDKISFEKWTHPDAEKLSNFEFSKGHSVNVFEIKSIHALNQFVGFAKYKCMQEGAISVYFRGQSELYKTLLPSIFRPTIGKKDKVALSKPPKQSIIERYNNVKKYIADCISKMHCLKNVDDRVVEPLLQHYGIKTSWLDIVDNLWVALWFAIHESDFVYTDFTEYEHIMLKKNIKKVYLLLIRSDADTPLTKGFLEGKQNQLVDLRESVPSIFLRPHAQHAMLIRNKKHQNQNDVDLADNVCAILSLNFSDVKNWLGEGKLLSAENIYPPAMYDEGYRFLLHEAPKIDKGSMRTYGFISSISYSM